MDGRFQRLAYDLFLVFWRVVINIFFREIRPRGAFHIPREGPLILVAAPHHNQFLDPLLLMSETFRETRRRVRCLIAAKSMKRKVIGFFAGMQGSIPVTRAADSATRGTGVIRISEDDPCLVLGENTKFLSELSPRKQITLPKSVNSAKAEVVEVISDTQVRVKKEFSGDDKKRTNKIREVVAGNSNEGLQFQVLPYVDQEEMYQHVYRTLKKGGCVGIFPEGGSHDRTDLLPLKVGVTVMALGAMSNNPALQVTIVPVGLSYFHPHRFRSRAVIEFGNPMTIPSELVELFKIGGEKKREACGKLMDIIYDGLKTVTLRTPDYDTLMMIQAARRLYKTPGQHLTLGQVVELNRRFMEGYEHFKDEPRVQTLRINVLKYNRLVRDLGLRDHQVPRAHKAVWKTLGLTMYRIGLLLVWTILALPGVILNGPIFLLAAIISRRKAKEALAASTVKIAGRDVLATWKVLVSLGVTPLLYGFYAVTVAIFAQRLGADLKWQFLIAMLVLIALPCIGFGALKFGEAGFDVLKSLRPLVVSLLPGQQKHLDRLKRMRNELSNELSDIVNEFGPKLYDDFDKSRILVPSAAVPPSGTSSGIWRRKSNTGAVDAQGNLLVHPMTWLDERLFGWPRRARGGYLWGDSESDSSHHATPETSEDEAGDYDDVFGMLRGYEGISTLRSRSGRSSYADLQQLRHSMADAIGARVSRDREGPVNPTTEKTEGEKQMEVNPRQSPRERRASLSDSVPVQRIGEVNSHQTFEQMTSILNQETLMKHPEK